jgi:hypothetical protein
VEVLNSCRAAYEHRSYLDIDPPAGAYELAAFEDCRRPACTAAMRLVDQRLDAWQKKHRSELLAIRREWRERVAAAAKLPR